MRAAYIEQTGPPETIQIGNVADASAAAGEVLVRVSAVSVNPIDTYIRGGANYWPLPQPYVIGSDLAGTVQAVGAEVTQFRPGDRVWGSNQGLMGRQGTFSELCAVNHEYLYPLPENVGFEDAAACALVGITAHLGLFQRARIVSSDTLLVHGGSGGVGSMVIQMAKITGATVIATAGDEQKAEICTRLGADHVIRYRETDESSAVREVAANGVDLFWETSRSPDLANIVDMMADRGRIVLMAGRDATPTLPVGPFYVKQLEMHGFVMFKALPEEQRQAAAQINAWLAAGRLKPQIDRTLDLSDAADAHRIQEQATVNGSGALQGKLVLTL